MDSDFLKEFGSFDPETSQPAEKTPEERAEANHKSFMRLAKKHEPIDHSCWAVEILKILILAPENHLVRITKVEIPDTCTAFVVSEESEILTSRFVQNMIGGKNFYFSKLNEGDSEVVTLFDVVHYPLNTTRLGCILYSRIFKSFPGESSPLLVVQYTTGSTIRMSASSLFDILSTQFSVMPGNPAEWSPPEPTPLLHRLSSPRDIMPVVASLCRRLDETEDYILSISHAYERTRRMLNAVLDVTRSERVKRNEGLNDVKDRIGHLHEQVMRNAISLAYGPDWGTQVGIRGFTDAVSFVSLGLGKSPLRREEGKIQLTKRFCKGLSSFKFDVPDYQSMISGGKKVSPVLN